MSTTVDFVCLLCVCVFVEQSILHGSLSIYLDTMHVDWLSLSAHFSPTFKGKKTRPMAALCQFLDLTDLCFLNSPPPPPRPQKRTKRSGDPNESFKATTMFPFWPCFRDYVSIRLSTNRWNPVACIHFAIPSSIHLSVGLCEVPAKGVLFCKELKEKKKNGFVFFSEFSYKIGILFIQRQALWCKEK